MTREFNRLKEIEKYYDEKTDTYVFKENDDYIDLVVFNFDLKVNANIDACNITAWDITAWDIDADDIKSWNINARNISYYAVCFAYQNIKCKSIKGRKYNAKHFVLDGKLEVEENVD